jgi:hypothetical protein
MGLTRGQWLPQPGYVWVGDPTPKGYSGYDLRLMFWGDGTDLPTSARNLVIIGKDDRNLLHFRIFDASGNRVKDEGPTTLPTAKIPEIDTLMVQLRPLLPPHVLTDAEKKEVISKATSIVGETRDVRVKWAPGTQHSLIANLIASDQEGGWTPAPGYAWKRDVPREVVAHLLGQPSREVLAPYAETSLELVKMGYAEKVAGGIAVFQMLREFGKDLQPVLEKLGRDAVNRLGEPQERERRESFERLDRLNSAGERFDWDRANGRVHTAK